MTTKYEISNIRTLLKEGFSDSELIQFCYDKPKFKELNNIVAPGMGKDQIIQHLIDYAERKELLDQLLNWAKQENPAKYELHQPYRDADLGNGNKLSIFISHIEEEAEVVSKLRDLIECAFPEQCRIFSAPHPGMPWLREIHQKLDQANLLLMLCSPISIKRPWINFEVGGAWIKNIRIIPICYAGQTKNSLPHPYSSFQAIELQDNDFVTKLFATLTAHLGTKPQRIKKNKITQLLGAQKKIEAKLITIKEPELDKEWDNRKLYQALKDAENNSEIKILQTWFPDSEDIFPHLEDLLKEHGKQFSFKILLMMEEEKNHQENGHSVTPLLAARVKLRGVGQKRAQAYIRATVERLQNMKNEVDQVWQEKYDDQALDLEVRQYKFMPFGPIYQIGQQVMFVGFYINFASSIKAPMLTIYNPQSKIWRTFHKNFELGWKDAEKVFPPLPTN